MNIRNLYMYFTGFVNITVEGFFTERFINSCFSNAIFLWDLQRENSSFFRVKISVKDFKKIKKIARATKCKVKISNKKGLPILIHKYRKRKILAIAILVIAIFIFVLTRFIWNIDIVGGNNINEEEIKTLLAESGIEIGKRKSEFNLDKAINKIRMQREDISWIGIDIKGTNLIVNINEADKSPEVIDVNEVCNIVADKDGEISKLIVKQGTARVAVGDKVKKGDLLVEGVMEGKYTGIRQVHAMADIEVKKYAEKEEKQNLVQQIETKTGNEEKNLEIKFHKFKINFNKRLSKFEKYDTIKTTKKLKFFSNYYLPIEVSKITYLEKNLEQKEYTVPELTDKIKLELEQKLNEELGLENADNVEKNVEVNVEGQEVYVKLIYIMYEKIGTKEVL
ncbi:MAG: sporulation protein YqfD [Clostridia bacterium]|nr:sporulation protein YqfD [Clostridia bacterium]